MTKQQYQILGSGIPEIKSSLLWDEKTDAWVYISGEPQKTEDPRNYYKILPTLYRAVDKRAKAVSGLPFALMRIDGENAEEIDESKNWSNEVGFIPSMKSLLWIIEASLTLAGRSYLKFEKNAAGYTRLLRHLDPTTLVLNKEKAENWEIEFERREKGRPQKYTGDEIVHVWYQDPYVELGPPTTAPAITALAACGVLANVDTFAKMYFARGAIKATLFAALGMPLDEKERFEKWWQRFVSGIKNAFTTRVINAEKVTPVVVGEGIKELENTTLTKEKKEEIAEAMDIPFTILFSGAANYATAERDKLNWMEDFVVPEAEFIAEVLNDQVFTPLGLQLVFKPETLDIFQEDEEQRAQSMSLFMDALQKAGSFEMAQALFSIFGIEADEESLAFIEQHFNAKETRRVEALDRRLPPAAPVGVVPAVEGGQTPGTGTLPAKTFDAQMAKELSIWRSKCVKAVRDGKPASGVPWRPQAIPADLFAEISEWLKDAKDEDDVAAAFMVGVEAEPMERKSAGDDFGELIATLQEGIRLVRETSELEDAR